MTMIGELIRNNPNAGKKNYSIIHWQTGEPTENDIYIVTLASGHIRLAEIFQYGVGKELWASRPWRMEDIVAWCKLSDIKPFKED